MVHPVTILKFWWIPSSKSHFTGQIGARTHSRTTLRTRSPLPSTHNRLCTPLEHSLGACRVDPGCDRLRMQIACGNRMPRDRFRIIADLWLESTSARSSSPNGLVRFFFQPAPLRLLHRQHWECLCTTAHALEPFSTLHAPNPNLNWLPLGLRPSSTIDSLARRRHSSTLGQLLLVLEPSSFRVETRRHHPLHHLTPICNSASFFLLVSSCRCTSLLSWSAWPLATFPGPLFLRCSGSLPRLRAPLRFAGPHVRMSDTARSQPWRPPGRGSDRAKSGGGGAGRKLSRPGFETKWCRAFRQPCQDRLHGSRTDTRTLRREPEFRWTDYKLQVHNII